MEFLIDPNIAYMIIVATAMLALLAIIVPGTGLPEMGLLICLGLAWYELSHLEPNFWALLALLLSLVPFLAALRAQRLRLPLLAIAILLISAGSAFMFVDQNGWPTVNPVLAVIVSVFSAGFAWFAVERGLKAQHAQPKINPDALIGRVGQARTEIKDTGSVQTGGELWSARSAQIIPAGSTVRIVHRDGFVLIVEKMSK
jgi:membrane-bound serine protease (ClpP class)